MVICLVRDNHDLFGLVDSIVEILVDSNLQWMQLLVVGMCCQGLVIVGGPVAHTQALVILQQHCVLINT